MTQPNIEYRSVRRSDYPSLETIISDAWNFQKYCSPKTAKALSKAYLAVCLANQTFTCTALRDGEPIGVIMGKSERTHRATLRQNLRMLAAILSLQIHREGRWVLAFFGGLDEIYNHLFHLSGRTFGGKLTFFAVRGDQRGAGIGQALFDRLQEYMQSQKITDFYLYTDTACNFGFYEHQGMQRLCEQKYYMPDDSTELLVFFYATASPDETRSPNPLSPTESVTTAPSGTSQRKSHS